MKKMFTPKILMRLRPLLTVAALFALNTVSAFAQSTTFNSTDLKTGISNSLAVIMMFGFVLGIFAVIYGGFAIRRGDVDQGKMSIIGGAIIAAAPAAVFAFYKIFGLDANSAVGVGNFLNEANPVTSSYLRPDRHERQNELRLTDTNAASDSKGRTWGLEGGLFWWLIGGIGAGITLFFVLLVVMGSSLATSFLVALVPVLICLAYIFGLRQGKPPGYDRDCFEYLLTGRGFSPQTGHNCTHPLL